MPKITSQSVIATPARDGNAAFAIIAETRHIDLFDEDKDRDMAEMDVHVHDVDPEPEW